MILILEEDYPSQNHKYALAYIHTRNLYYKKMGLEFTVLNFRAKSSYTYEGINVISYEDYKQKESSSKIDLLISHAPNLRNHVKFMVKNKRNIEKILMVIHRHEVLKYTKYYPKPFHFNNANKGKNFVQNVYDSIKLPSMRFIIRKYLKQNKITLLFVSEWMRTHFELNVKINKNEYMDHSIVIPNSSHPIFVDNSYQYNQLEKEADFITIRPFDRS